MTRYSIQRDSKADQRADVELGPDEQGGGHGEAQGVDRNTPKPQQQAQTQSGEHCKARVAHPQQRKDRDHGQDGQRRGLDGPAKAQHEGQQHAGKQGRGDFAGDAGHQIFQRPDQAGQRNQHPGQDEGPDRFVDGVAGACRDQRRARRGPGQNHGHAAVPAKAGTADRFGKADGQHPACRLRLVRPDGDGGRQHQRDGRAIANKGGHKCCRHH